MDILFAVMPFADVGRPAIGVSLLDAGASGFRTWRTFSSSNTQTGEIPANTPGSWERK